MLTILRKIKKKWISSRKSKQEINVDKSEIKKGETTSTGKKKSIEKEDFHKNKSTKHISIFCITTIVLRIMTIVLLLFICFADFINPSFLSSFIHSDIAEKDVSSEQQSSTVRLEGPYSVVNVVDGDTVIVLLGSVETKVRLIGVNTPESVHSDESKNTEEGKIASDWTKILLEEELVYLEFDVGKTDKYGRLLAYVYLDDEKTMVNRLLIEEGLAQTMTIYPNSKYTDEFNALQKLAREGKKGFWHDI